MSEREWSSSDESIDDDFAIDNGSNMSEEPYSINLETELGEGTKNCFQQLTPRRDFIILTQPRSVILQSIKDDTAMRFHLERIDNISQVEISGNIVMAAVRSPSCIAVMDMTTETETQRIPCASPALSIASSSDARQFATGLLDGLLTKCTYPFNLSNIIRIYSVVRQV